MESPDLYKLRNLLTVYRQSLGDLLDKIDSKIYHAVNNYKDTHTKQSSFKKYKISMQMIEVLKNHIKVVHAYENISETLSFDLSQLEQDTQPEKDNSIQNPFLAPSLIPLVKAEEDCLDDDEIHTECNTQRQCRNFNIERDCTSRESSGREVSESAEGYTIPTDGSTQTYEDIVNQQKIRFDDFVQELTDSSSDTLKAEMVDEVDYVESELENVVPKEEATRNFFLFEDNLPEESTEPNRLAHNLPNIEYHMDDNLESERLSVDQYSSSSSSEESTQLRKQIKSQSSPNYEVTRLAETCSKEAVAKKQVTFDIDETSESQKYDWRRETVKLFENRRLKVALRWTGSNDQTPLQPESQKRSQASGGSFVIAEDDLAVGERCIFCHIKSPSEFYVCTNPSLLESFEEHINEVMNKNWQQVVNKHKSKMEAKEHLGNFCFGFWSTRRKWYRVEVLDWMDNEHDKIMVQLIDYGKKLFYSYTNLKGLGDLVYSMFPKLAIRCHLTGICSPHLLNSVWPQKTIDFFVKLSEWTERTEFQVIFAHKDGNSYGVDLRKAGDADADSLGELLVKNGYAFEERVSDEDFLNTLDEKDLEECGDECEGSDDLEKVLSEETNQMSLPLDGEHVEIMVTGYLLDTCHFYARILRNFSTNTYFVDEFRRLIETMNASNTVQGYEAFTLLPEIGEVVLVKEGAAWNRGRCDRYTDIQDVEVFLVDFGYTVVKPFSHLRKMKDEFLQVPFQAVECMLSNCKEKEAVSDEMSLSFFNNVMRMKTFLARVVETTRGVMKLQMWDMDNIEMSQVLKTFGLGEDR